MTPYDSPEWHALVAGIRAAPGEDTPRLVAADWLEDHGLGERAAFVREQVLYGVDGKAFVDGRGPRWTYYSSRKGGNRKGESDSVRRWLPPCEWFPDHAGLVFLTIHRGFLSSVRCPAAAWLAHGDALYAREPVTRVVLTTMPMYGWQFTRWWRDGATEICYATDARWPGVELVLPGPTVPA